MSNRGGIATVDPDDTAADFYGASDVGTISWLKRAERTARDRGAALPRTAWAQRAHALSVRSSATDESRSAGSLELNAHDRAQRREERKRVREEKRERRRMRKRARTEPDKAGDEEGRDDNELDVDDQEEGRNDKKRKDRKKHKKKKKKKKKKHKKKTDRIDREGDDDGEYSADEPAMHDGASVGTDIDTDRDDSGSDALVRGSRSRSSSAASSYPSMTSESDAEAAGVNASGSSKPEAAQRAALRWLRADPLCPGALAAALAPGPGRRREAARLAGADNSGGVTEAAGLRSQRVQGQRQNCAAVPVTGQNCELLRCDIAVEIRAIAKRLDHIGGGQAEHLLA